MSEPTTGPSAMRLSDAERIKRLERIVEAARREGSEDSEIVEIVKAFMENQPKNGNGTAQKIGWILGAFAVCGVFGSYLAVETISHGKELAALRAEVASCLKKP